MVKCISVSVNQETLDLMDEYCKDYNVSRSSLISTACTSYIQAQKGLPDVLVQLDELKEIVGKLQAEKIASV